MALADRIRADRSKVFVNPAHFGSRHTWNGKPFLCVCDESNALYRKSIDNSDPSWDNNTRDVTLYVPEEDFPGKPIPGGRGYFDNRSVRIVQVSSDMGILTVVLATTEPGVSE